MHTQITICTHVLEENMVIDRYMILELMRFVLIL